MKSRGGRRLGCGALALHQRDGRPENQLRLLIFICGALVVMVDTKPVLRRSGTHGQASKRLQSCALDASHESQLGSNFIPSSVIPEDYEAFVTPLFGKPIQCSLLISGITNADDAISGVLRSSLSMSETGTALWWKAEFCALDPEVISNALVTFLQGSKWDTNGTLHALSPPPSCLDHGNCTVADLCSTSCCGSTDGLESDESGDEAEGGVEHASSYYIIRGKHYPAIFSGDSTGAYGRQPFAEQVIDAEFVIDPWLVAMAEEFIPTEFAHLQPTVYLNLTRQVPGGCFKDNTVPASGGYGTEPCYPEGAGSMLSADGDGFCSCPSKDFLFASCDLTERMTREMVTGKVLAVPAAHMQLCSIARGIDDYFSQASSLGAVAVAALVFFWGSRFACSTIYSPNPAPPEPRMPVFCSRIDLEGVATAALLEYVQEANRLHSQGLSLTQVPIVIGRCYLKHDGVPIDIFLSTGYYAFHMILFVVLCLIILSSIYNLQCAIRGLLRHGISYSKFLLIPFTLLTLEGVVASSLRAIRSFLSPIDFSPRYPHDINLLLPNLVKFFPTILSSVCTLLVAGNHLWISIEAWNHEILMRWHMTVFKLLTITVATVLLTLPTYFVTLTLLSARDVAEVVTSDMVLDLSEYQPAEKMTFDLREATDAFQTTLRVASRFVLATYTFAQLLFLSTGFFLVFEICRVAKLTEKAAFYAAARGLLRFISMQSLFSIPVMINIVMNSEDLGRIEYRDDAVGTYAFFDVASFCEIVLALTQVRYAVHDLRYQAKHHNDGVRHEFSSAVCASDQASMLHVEVSQILSLTVQQMNRFTRKTRATRNTRDIAETRTSRKTRALTEMSKFADWDRMSLSGMSAMSFSAKSVGKGCFSTQSHKKSTRTPSSCEMSEAKESSFYERSLFGMNSMMQAAKTLSDPIAGLIKNSRFAPHRVQV